MSKFLIAAFAFVAVAAVGTTSHAQFRDAGSKARGDAYEGTSDALRTYRTYYTAPAAAPQPVVAATPAAPAQPPANATAAVGNAPSGTRTMSVEPQAAASTMTYRAVAPRRSYSRTPWMYRADHKVLGHFNP
jgi:hypothetical protein